MGNSGEIRGHPQFPASARAQGESIAYGPDGESLYLASEKVPTPLLEVPVTD